jgi:hypothetical protein
MNPCKRPFVFVFAAVCCFGTMRASTMQAQPLVYPVKNQSADQQKRDEAECGQRAVQQTGFDPASAQVAGAVPPPTTPTGTTAGAGARGAAGGAIIGGIAGNAGAGAAAGAVVARSRSRRANAASQQQAAQQQQQLSAQHAAYAQARSACLEGRGYTVK